MSLEQIIDIIERVAPVKWQEAWDNSGLQVGERNADITAALLTTDVTEDVVSEAVERHCQLIISHHPLLYHGLKTISGTTPEERCVMMALRHGIAIYSSHTSMDNCPDGVSGRMAEHLGLVDCHVLVPGGNARTPDEYGLGIIGRLPSPVLFEDFLSAVQKAFAVPVLRYIPAPVPKVQTVTLCGGAGSDFMEDAVRQGADVYLSADFKYHGMQAAIGRIGLIDMDHWYSEHFTRDIFAELLQGKIKTFISRNDRSPVRVKI